MFGWSESMEAEAMFSWTENGSLATFGWTEQKKTSLIKDWLEKPLKEGLVNLSYKHHTNFR
jgi:hypothetical protein